MRNIRLWVFFVIGFSFIAVSHVGAEEIFSKSEVETLLAGNTVELQDMKWKKSAIWYFKKNGRLNTQDEYGNVGKGKWYVDKEARLCTEKKHRELRCRVLVAREGGGYGVYEREFANNELKWIFKRILPGNPHDL